MSNAENAAQAALPQFVAHSRARLQQLLERMQWTQQGVIHLHRPVKADQVSPHIEQLPPSCSTAPEHSVQLSTTQLQQLLGPLPQVQLQPKTFEDLQANFSASQKLLMYEHVRQSTPQHDTSCQPSAHFAQLVAQTKKAHQQQRRYRKSKPTLQDEMHQLVELQMQALQREHQQRAPGDAAAAVNLASKQQLQIVRRSQRRRHSPHSSRGRERSSSGRRKKRSSRRERRSSSSSSSSIIRRRRKNSSKGERSISSRGRRERSINNRRKRERSISNRRKRERSISSPRKRERSISSRKKKKRSISSRRKRERSISSPRKRERSISSRRKRERSISSPRKRERSITSRKKKEKSRRSSKSNRRHSRSRQRHSSKRSHGKRSPGRSPGHARQQRPYNRKAHLALFLL